MNKPTAANVSTPREGRSELNSVPALRAVAGP